MPRLATIRQRLRLSNVLTLVVPLVVCVLVGLACVGVFLFQVHGGLDLGVSDAEDMTTLGRVVSESAGHVLEATPEGDARDSALAAIAQGVKGSGMVLKVYDQEGDVVFGTGTPSQEEALLAATRPLDDKNGVLVSAAGTSLYLHAEGDYHVALFGSYAEARGDAIKTAALISGLVLVVAAVVSTLAMDRVGRRLVYDRITRGLSLLGDGVGRVADGDLAYRIDYPGQDEFAPICDDFNAMAERLEEAERSGVAEERRRRELVAGISHDLRSPLTSIQGYVEGLLDGVASTPEQRDRYLRTIRRKTQELSRLVEDLFLFSKLDLEDYPCELATTDLAASVHQILEDLAPGYDESVLRIVEEPAAPDLAPDGAAPAGAASAGAASVGSAAPAGAAPAVECRVDRALLQRCISNVVGNAAKYAAGGTLTVSVGEKDGVATVSLCDDGVGVPAEERSRLFDVFYRSDPARQHTGSGSGLGLAIVARAMRRMGGAAEAAESPSGGLAILLHFPATSLAQGADAPAAGGPAAGSPAGTAPQGPDHASAQGADAPAAGSPAADAPAADRTQADDTTRE
ncbi:MAG: HAMP domain-containing sensor histidine kinase [Olsenella sp.]|jgi:signal transduction histidine kinase